MFIGGLTQFNRCILGSKLRSRFSEIRRKPSTSPPFLGPLRTLMVKRCPFEHNSPSAWCNKLGVELWAVTQTIFPAVPTNLLKQGVPAGSRGDVREDVGRRGELGPSDVRSCLLTPTPSLWRTLFGFRCVTLQCQGRGAPLAHSMRHSAARGITFSWSSAPSTASVAGTTTPRTPWTLEPKRGAQGAALFRACWRTMLRLRRLLRSLWPHAG